ncbi:pilus assembly protein [Salmonella enterica subsp. enterica serovar Muenchen]|uniref:Pilus assembly protein n=1 Tax=Salmonella enterica subsp. enterica serovar Ank TaxID=1173578 RepID=A0A5I2X9L4_SALET|nr:ATPase, T2SS/T4P/T4SS family [Salmonella enterica]EBS1326925.1 pilus assembly protein [Salmonella enterica subsp. enterica serovar Muenchen]EBY9282883.1 pilus assembly protein [Salmonella enterica subsp. enterica serovar Denver]ECF3885278.1 pilus assembly protein [Salmonella enterica subsp. enterica serovar Ank]ECD5428004.1 pilus assembly protein [Salmonella enterica subsp. enterica serovar Denver]EJM3644925.1 Flp pilus assembly complex ATPase component TadA [Salmonella enterica]
MNFYDFLRIDDDNLLSDWKFSLIEEKMLVGENKGSFSLMVHQLNISVLGDIQQCILFLKLYCDIDVSRIVLIKEMLYYSILDKVIKRDQLSRELMNSSVQQDLEKLLIAAVDIGASDLHITRTDRLATIEFRVNGILIPHSTILSTKCDELCFVLYNVQASTKETTWNRAIPQSANILYSLGGRSFRFRYAHFPVFGETTSCYHCVLRIIPAGIDNVVFPSLDKLGLSGDEIEDIKKVLSNPYGVYVVAGTTGSGKSTTLKNLMEWLQKNRYSSRGCFLTIEDPVEYQIWGAKQSSVLDVDGGGFHAAIKSALRRDPDVLMVGEIRDTVSANALAGAVESGHYCFTTVHAGNIVTLLQRLVALGISPDKLATPGFIAGIQCQKLLPILCHHCKKELKYELFRRCFNVFILNEEGCEHCFHTGLKGRQLVVEYMLPTYDELAAISNNRWLEVYTIWRKKRFTSSGIAEGFELKEKAFHHVLRGNVCASWFSMEFGKVEQKNLEVLIEKTH